MRRSKLFLAVTALLSVVAFVHAQDQATPKATDALSREARVDELFVEMDRPDSPGCAVSVMRQGAIVYKRGYGMANLEYGVPITPSSVFHVASVSKQFTAFAVALLAAEGKLSLDDEIHEYIPEVPDHGVPITIRHLLHHTSGLRDQWDLLSMAGWRWEADVVTQKDVLEVIALQEALNFAPGDEYLYSNTGYTLLAVIVERISGQSLRQFATERIFEPLGMSATHFHDDHEMIVLNRAYAYKPAGQGNGARAGGFSGDLKQSIPDFDVVGASSLFTTVEDLARWDRNFYTRRIGGSEVMEWMHTRGVLNNGDEISYALALAHGEHRGLETVSHGGADAGYRSHFLRYPEQALSVAVLCNFPSSGPGDLAREVGEVYLGEEMADAEAVTAAGAAGAGTAQASDQSGPPPEVDMSEDELAVFAGLYRYPGTDRVARIGVFEGKLLWRGERPRRLVPVGDGRFLLEDDGPLIAFEITGEEAVLILPADAEDPEALNRVEAADPDPDLLAEYEGTYFSPELGTAYSLILEGSHLIMRHRKLDDRNLRPTFVDGFNAGNRTLRFTRDSDGSISGFRMSSGRVRGIRFERTGS